MEAERFRSYFEGWEDDKYYADAQTTAASLGAAGFEEIETWLHDEVAAFDSVGDSPASSGWSYAGTWRLPEEDEILRSRSRG